MIVDLSEPQSTAQTESRSRNPIKLATDFIASMRGEDRSRSDNDDSSSLDDTRSRMSPPVPSNDSEFRANDRRVQIPQWLLLFLIVQGATVIWWAATMQSDLRYQEREKLRLENKIDTEATTMKQEIKLYDLQRQKDVERVRDQVRDEVANQLLSRGIIRVQQPNP